MCGGELLGRGIYAHKQESLPPKKSKGREDTRDQVLSRSFQERFKGRSTAADFVTERLFGHLRVRLGSQVRSAVFSDDEDKTA